MKGQTTTKEYKIISSPLKNQIESEISLALLHGWNLAGGITFDSDDIYYQAIYRE